MDRGIQTVVFFGDSLTRGDYLERGFVNILSERWKEDLVLNYGVDGDTAEDLLSRVARVQAERPDWVFLMVGANDCGWSVQPEQYRATLAELVDRLHSARVVMVTPTTSVFYKGANTPYVAAMKEVAVEKGVPVIDFAAEIQDSDYGFDGLHWSEAGHARLAETIDRWWREARTVS